MSSTRITFGPFRKCAGIAVLAVLGVTGIQPALAQQTEEGIGLAEVVRLTLEQNYTIRIQDEQTRISEGGVLAAAGAFDPLFNASLVGGHEETPFTQAQRQLTGSTLSKSSLTTYRLGLNKRFRSGLILSPGVEVVRTQALGTGAPAVIQTRASLVLRVPLLRGRGANASAARFDAAQDQLTASELTLRHTTAGSLLEAVYAYWNYLAARKRLDILMESETRARGLLTDTRALVEGGERPVADLDQLRANLADKITARINGEQQLYEARQALGLALGLPFEQFDRIPEPSEDFPGVEGETASLPSRETLTKYALEHRRDLRSARKIEEAALRLFKAYRSEARPQFDLQVDLGYTGLSENGAFRAYLPPLGQNDAGGPSATVSLVYSLPTGNRSARGVRLQQEATYAQRRMAADDLMRKISSGVAVASEALLRSAAELSRAHEAVVLYRTAVEHEKKKLRLGMSTLFDVTIVEDRMTNALLAEVNAQVRYARALGRLRFETGTLLVEDGGTGAQVRALTSIPLQ
ncbi:TolC family protein [Rhodocaloribacter sp.]